MATQSVYGQELQVHSDNAAAATVTLTLPSPGAGRKHVVKWVAAYTAGAAVSVLDFEIQKNDATTIVRCGGVVAAGAVPNYFVNFGGSRNEDGVPGFPNDQTKIVLTATTATSCRVTAGVVTVPA